MCRPSWSVTIRQDAKRSAGFWMNSAASAGIIASMPSVSWPRSGSAGLGVASPEDPRGMRSRRFWRSCAASGPPPTIPAPSASKRSWVSGSRRMSRPSGVWLPGLKRRWPRSRQPRLTAYLPKSGSALSVTDSPPPSPASSLSGTSPSRPTSGMRRGRASSKPIPSPTVGTRWPGSSPSLDITDIATGWTEQRAVWGKGERGVLEQIISIEASLPFSILGFDCDNGGEFLQWHLIRYFQNRPKPVQFTRSRPYQKYDNAHIEQKNWTHVRQWLGYQRFEKPALVEQLNELYTSEWRLFHNFFLPSAKLQSKERRRSKIIKVHDNPKTPYQRILDSKHIPQRTKDKLTDHYQTLNPFQLRKAIDQKINKIKQLAR